MKPSKNMVLCAVQNLEAAKSQLQLTGNVTIRLNDTGEEWGPFYTVEELVEAVSAEVEASA